MLTTRSTDPKVPRRRRLLLFVAVVSCLWTLGARPPVASADVDWRGGNQLEYSLERQGGREILEDWFDLEWFGDDLTAGIRYEVFQPHELSPDSVSQGLPFKYFSYTGQNVSVTAGNFYALWGRGLALQAYEDRGVRRDSNLEGVRVDLTSGPADVCLISGRALDQRSQRRDLLHGLDVNVEPLSVLRVGLSYLSNRAPHRTGTRTNELATLRAQFTTGPVDLYVERGTLSGLQGQCSTGHRDGKALYAAASLSAGPVGISIEHKDYEGFRFVQSDCATEYNLPPALIREHAFTLLNRHPHELDADDERGTQVELVASAGALGDFILAGGETENQAGEFVFQETYLQWDKTGENGHALGAVDLARRPGQKETTLVGEGQLWFREQVSAKAQFQHQHVEGEGSGPYNMIGAYDDEMFLLELSPTYDFTVALVGEWTDKSEIQRSAGDKTRWFHAIVTRNIGTGHYASVMYGTRQAGFICAGGVCRYEPAFDGLEFKLFSTF